MRSFYSLSNNCVTLPGMISYSFVIYPAALEPSRRKSINSGKLLSYLYMCVSECKSDREMMMMPYLSRHFILGIVIGVGLHIHIRHVCRTGVVTLSLSHSLSCACSKCVEAISFSKPLTLWSTPSSSQWHIHELIRIAWVALKVYATC